MSERSPITNMVCTECGADAGPAPDVSKLALEVIIHVCNTYKCTKCLDEDERDEQASCGIFGCPVHKS